MSKTIVISGYYGYNNFGDELILKAILQELEKTKPRIIVLSGNVRNTTKIHGVETINRYNIFAILKALKKADILISGGGGLLQDKTSKRSLIYYLFIILFAKFNILNTIIVLLDFIYSHTR